MATRQRMNYSMLFSIIIWITNIATAQGSEDVVLTSTLADDHTAPPEQEIVFTCTTRHSSILQWSSSEYISSDGYNIQVYNGTSGNDVRRGSAHATLVLAVIENGVLVLVSELRIRMSTLHPTATVECNNNGHGSSQTIKFALQNVTLTSTLTDGLVAYGEEEIIFTCTTRHSSILQWSSSEYISSDGYNIQVYNGTSGNDVRRGSAHATLVRAVVENGVLVLVSELRIQMNTLHPTATIECSNNGHGSSRTITFALQNVTLTSTLTDGLVVYGEQEIVFTCTTRHSSILQWSSSEYISSDGYNIQVYNGTSGNDVRRGSAHATLVRAVIENGVLVLVSELRIRTNTLHPTATIECNNNGHGSSRTITFDLVPEVASTSEPIVTTSMSVPDDQFLTTVTVTAERDDNNNAAAAWIAGVIFCAIVIILAVVIAIIIFICIKIRRKSKVHNKTPEYGDTKKDDIKPDSKDGHGGKQASRSETEHIEVEPSAPPEKEMDEELDDVKPQKKAEKQHLLPPNQQMGGPAQQQLSGEQMGGAAQQQQKQQQLPSEQMGGASQQQQQQQQLPDQEMGGAAQQQQKQQQQQLPDQQTDEASQQQQQQLPDRQVGGAAQQQQQQQLPDQQMSGAAQQQQQQLPDQQMSGAAQQLQMGGALQQQQQQLPDQQMGGAAQQQQQQQQLPDQQMSGAAQQLQMGGALQQQQQQQLPDQQMSGAAQQLQMGGAAQQQQQQLPDQQMGGAAQQQQQQQLPDQQMSGAAQQQQQQLPDQQMGGAAQQQQQQPGGYGVISNSDNEQQLGSPNPKGQLGDSGLTKAKHNVESLEGSPGDARGSMASEEGEALGPPGDVCIGSQEAVGYNDSGDMESPRKTDSLSSGSPVSLPFDKNSKSLPTTPNFLSVPEPKNGDDSCRSSLSDFEVHIMTKVYGSEPGSHAARPRHMNDIRNVHDKNSSSAVTTSASMDQPQIVLTETTRC